VRALTLALLFLPLVLVLTACSRITNPQGWASPLITNSTLLAEPNHQTLAAADLSSGSRQWTFPGNNSKTALKAIYGTPAISQGLALLGGYDGNLYALSLADGSQKWSQPVGSHIVGGPATSDDTVYIGSADQCLHAFAVATGDQRFNPFCTGAKIWSTPTFDGSTVYVASMDKKLYAIGATSGTSVWPKPFQTGGAIASTPVVDSSTVYVGAFDDKFYAVDASSGEMRWSFKADDWIWNRAVVSGGAVYFGSLGGKVYSLDASTGQSRWDKPFQGSGVVRGGPALVGSTLVVATDNGSVYGLDASSGSQIWSSKANAGVLSDLTVDSGMVYYSTKSGNVQKVDPADGTITDVPISS
jgi:outer membrane protein assembly factor BamB